jgi:hypothetical protein
MLNPSTRLVEYQFSVINAKQDVFNRQTARHLALGRLVENPITVPLQERNLNMFDISRAVMKNLSRRKDAPSRAVKAAKLWLKQNENKA